MPAPIFIPPPINSMQKCNRCNLQFPTEEKFCPHCKELTDEEVKALKLKKQEEHKGNSNLGKFFIYAAILLILLMVAVSNT